MNFISGIVLLTGNLQILNGATVNNANDNSFVQGTIVKFGNQAFTFPLGLNGLYRPIAISAPVNTGDNFTATYNYADPSPSFTHTSKDASIDHISRCEHWILNRTGGSSIVYVTLSWNINSCGVSSISDLVVSRWDAGQVKWKDHGNGATTGNTTAGTVISSGPVAVFSPFTLGSKNSFNPLPIELLDFSLKCEGDELELNWSTASETNNDYFLVESTSDGIEWQELARVKSKGNGSLLRKYELEESLKKGELIYYRLSQVDLDGKKESFKTILANCDDAVSGFKFYPNPANDQINLVITSSLARSEGVLRIMDNLGRTALKTDFQLKKGTNVLPLQLTLPKGIYFVSFTSESFSSEVQKLIIH